MLIINCFYFYQSHRPVRVIADNIDSRFQLRLDFFGANGHLECSGCARLDFALAAQSVLQITRNDMHTRMAVGMSEEAVPFLLEGISFFGPKIWR